MARSSVSATNPNVGLEPNPGFLGLPSMIGRVRPDHLSVGGGS